MIENGCDKFFPKPGFSRSASNIHGPKQSLMRVLRTFLRGKSGYSHERPVKESAEDIRAANGRLEPRQRLRVFFLEGAAERLGIFLQSFQPYTPGTGQRQQAPGDVSAGRQYWSRLHLARLRFDLSADRCQPCQSCNAPSLHRPDPIMSDFKQLSRSVKGLTVLVTGAASGMGRATALVFASDGANVAVTDISAEATRAVASEIASRGGSAKAWTLDVADRDNDHRRRQRRRGAFRRARYRRQQCRHLRARRDRR